ncbi:MAG: flagellar assembly protein FliW [candidate division Zixibacteria bacterium]|nr:flagellar assembly protein FliW [candidate division Zixibacteria bacterium]MBU1469616.1 flagellar assembly protein FliW [candidate division Zixibacteria bacterium]MBU2625501.1 flagellar assembly protein FliW [candidate division Zixibacteria bacterium]
MKIATLRFGELDVPEDKMVEFPKGILGFEQFQKYVILQNEDSEPFKWMQSIEDPNLAFVIANPAFFFPNYKIEMHIRELNEINVAESSCVETYVIVTIPKDISQMSANLQGPLLINTDDNLGKQVVFVNSRYTIRHLIMDELKKKSGKNKTEPLALQI